MRMTRWISLALAAILALTVAGIAVAHKASKSGKTEATQATFTATPDAAKTKTRQCTGEDGTYNITHGVYTGTSTGDPRLTGNVTIKSESVVNLDNGLGWTKGRVYLRDGSTGKLKANAGLDAVNTQRGKLDGFLKGQARDTDGKGHLSLLANFSATFNADGTQLTGELGSEAPVPPQNSAILHGKPCKPEKKPHPHPQNGGHENHGHHGGPKGDDDHK
jgi:hypothetical protein